MKKMFEANGNTKHLQICTRHEDCGCLHSNITVWSLAGFLLGLLRAIQTVTHLYSASGWSCLNYYIVTIFSPRCKSGLDFAWHWALAWLRHGLYESKCRQKRTYGLHVYDKSKLCAIPDNKTLANRVQKIRFNAACWSNHRYYVTCGRHLNAVSYFVLWYFLICPTSSTRLLWLYKPQSVSALCCVCVQSFCSSQRLWAQR